jgi:outer membrane protein assembly factor BamB
VPLPGSVRDGSTIAGDANHSPAPRWPYIGHWHVYGPGSGPADWRADKPAVPIATPDKADANTWHAATAEMATGFVYLTQSHHEDANRGAAATPLRPGDAYWSATALTVPRDGLYQFAAGVDGRLAAWIDGTFVAAGPADLDPAMEESVLRFGVALKAGKHDVVVRCHPNGKRAKFWMRVCVAEGEEPRRPPAGGVGGYAHGGGAPTVVGYRNDGTARYPDARPVTAWDLPRGINLRWRTPLLWSKAQPIIVGDRAFVTEEPHALVCLDKRTGRVVWRRESNILEMVDPNAMKRHDELKAAAIAARERVLAIGASPWQRKAKLAAEGLDANSAERRLIDIEWQALDAHEQWVDYVRTAGGCVMPLVYRRAREAGPWTGFSFATPVSDGRHVWVRYGTGLTACYDLDGNRRWMVRTPLVQSSGSECSSPVLVDGLLVMQFIHKQEHKIWLRFDKAWLLALDPATGREVWRTDVLDWRPNSTPAVVHLANARERVTMLVTGSGTVVRAADGKVLVPRMLGNDGYSSPTVEGHSCPR